jgi:cysteine synthase A
VLPDSGERYLSGPLYEGLFTEVETMTASPAKP